MDLNKTNGAQNAKKQNVKAQKAKSKNAKKAVGGFVGIRKYIAIGLLMAVMIITAVGFSKWNIHIQQTLTVGGNTNAPLLGYVTEDENIPQNAILNRYLKVEYTNVNANGNTENKSTAVSEIADASFTYNGKPFAVSVSAPNAVDVAATWANWGITFTYTYYQTTVKDSTTTYSDGTDTPPTNVGTYICVVTATKENTTLENDTTGKNRAATSEENTTATNTTAIENLNFLTNPATNEKKSCAAIVTYTINPQLITAPTAVKKDYTYTGSEQTFTLSNFDSEKMNVSVSGETARIDGTNILATNAGTYTVTVSLKNTKDTTNYVWKDILENGENNSKNGTNTALTFTWTIKQANLTIRVEQPESIVKGAPIPSFTSSFTGLVGDDKESDFTLTYSCNYTTTSEAGDYTVSVEASGVKVNNYAITYEDATLTVTATPTLTPTLTPTFECTEINSSDVYMEGDVIEVTVTVKDKDGNAADLGDLTLTDSGTNNLEKQGTGTYTLKIYVLYNDGNPSNANTNVVFTPQINLTFTSTNTDYSDTEYTAKPCNVTVKPVAYNKSTTQYYGTLNKALNAAESGQAVYLIPGSFITVTEALTVKSGVTLYVPYADETYDNTDEESLEGNYSVAATRISQITFEKGADFIINGTVYLGAKTGTKGVYESYTEITLDSSSHIQVNGSFYCYGYVKELNPVISNTEAGDYSNANDSARYIEVSATGFLESPMAIYDMKSGGTLYQMINNNICPLNQFDFPSLQTYTKIVSGAKVDGYVKSLVADVELKTKASVIRKNTSEDAMFFVTSGYFALEYIRSTLSNYYLSGDIELGYLKFTVSVYTINTSQYFLPLSSRLKIYALSGSNITVSKDVKLLPGGFFQINDGASMTISSQVAVHTKATYGSGTDAQFINNGTLTLTSTGAFGGTILTTQDTKDRAVLDFTNTTASSFSVTTKEFDNAIEMNYFAQGTFYTDSGTKTARFVIGSTVKSYGNGSDCWYGEMDDTNTLTINVTQTEEGTRVCYYHVYQADDANGTNSTELTPTDGVSANGSYTLTNGKYFKVVENNYVAAEFTNSPNGSADFSNDTWYQVAGDYTLLITANIGYTFYVEGDWQSGAANSVYTVYVSKEKNGTYVEYAKSSSGCIDNILIAKNYWFYVTFKGGTGSSGTTSVGTVTIEKGPDDLTTFEFSKDDKYQMTCNYRIHVDYERCLVEGTLITLADGSKKKVENVTANDTLLVFNHETGKYDFAKVLFNDSEPLADYTVINLKFSNGKTVKVVSEHGFFDLTLNKYVYIDEFNYSDYVGHKFYSATWDGIVYNNAVVTLTNAYLTTEHTRVYSPVTKYHLNYFTEDLLSMPGGIEGLFNIFEYGKDLKYDEDLKKADLELYGELTYADFKDLVSLEMYESYPANYFAVAIGKGILSWDKINYYIERYGPLTEPDNVNESNSVSESDSGGGEDNASYSAAKEAAFLPTSADKDNSSAALPEDS